MIFMIILGKKKKLQTSFLILKEQRIFCKKYLIHSKRDPYIFIHKIWILYHYAKGHYIIFSVTFYIMLTSVKKSNLIKHKMQVTLIFCSWHLKYLLTMITWNSCNFTFHFAVIKTLCHFQVFITKLLRFIKEKTYVLYSRFFMTSIWRQIWIGKNFLLS